MLDGPDMIFVPVCEAAAVQFDVIALFKPAKIGNDIIDAMHVVGREHNAAIEQESVPVQLEQGHILADFSQTSNGRDFENCFCSHVGFSPNTNARQRMPLRVKLNYLVMRNCLSMLPSDSYASYKLYMHMPLD